LGGLVVLDGIVPLRLGGRIHAGNLVVQPQVGPPVFVQLAVAAVSPQEAVDPSTDADIHRGRPSEADGFALRGAGGVAAFSRRGRIAVEGQICSGRIHRAKEDGAGQQKEDEKLFHLSKILKTPLFCKFFAEREFICIFTP